MGLQSHLPVPLLSAGAVNDYQKDMQFKKLNEQKDVVEVKVQRGGHLILVLNSEVMSP